MVTGAMSDLATRSILHVDMDAFFASVETLDNPELEGKAVIVGGLGPRGVVATANYAARKFGARSAIPMGTARRLCPHGCFIRPRMSRYRELSTEVFKVFHSITPMVEGLSLDEAFLDVTASHKLFGPAEEIAHLIKQRIQQEIGLTASVGVAHNKFLAKLASDLQKPDGLVCVPRDKVHQFLDPMPISRLWGVGPKTSPKLKSQGILTFGQLRRADRSVLEVALGKRAEHYRKLASGEDEREVKSAGVDKSISHEITFDKDLTGRSEMLGELQTLTEAVARRLRARQLIARTVSIKVRDSSFKTITRSKSIRASSNSTMTLYRMARALFENWRKGHRATAVRLLGMGVSGLEHRFGQDQQNKEQGNQLDSQADKRIDEVFDNINKRYGESRIVHGMTMQRRRDKKD
jgi:DNA polymerase-4